MHDTMDLNGIPALCILDMPKIPSGRLCLGMILLYIVSDRWPLRF